MDAGNAKLQGLTEQLHLVGNQYNIALVSKPRFYTIFLKLIGAV